MGNDARRDRLHRSPKLGRRQPTATAPGLAAVDLEDVGGQAALVELEISPQSELLRQQSASSADWMTRHELCVQIKIRPETLYRMVVAGEVLFARDGARLLYKTVNPSNTYVAGASPGDTRELAARQPPQLDHVGALAAFVDELSECLIRSEQALQAAQGTSKEALKRVRQTTDAHAALSERHDEVAQRLRGYQYALDRSHRALQRSNAESGRLRADLEQLLGEIEDLALSPLGMPVRRRLKAILARVDAVLADPKDRPLPES